jgi:hypothetical protein
MQKRSPWQSYADGHAADFEAGGKVYLVIVTDGYVNARYRMTADRIVDRGSLIEELEDEIIYLAGEKLKRGAVFESRGKRPPQITLDSKDAQTS